MGMEALSENERGCDMNYGLSWMVYRKQHVYSNNTTSLPYHFHVVAHHRRTRIRFNCPSP
jgi:hypothetical protein